MAKTFQPTFSSSVKVSPSHCPPASIAKDSEPFFQLLQGALARTSLHLCISHPASPSRILTCLQSALKKTPQHQSTSQLRSDRYRPGSSSPKRTGTDSSATEHQSTSQLQSDRNRPRFGTDSSITRHQSTTKLHVSKSQTDQPRSSVPTYTGSPALHRQRQASIFSVSSEAGSDFSD